LQVRTCPKSKDSVMNQQNTRDQPEQEQSSSRPSIGKHGE
jgi:hypothetical protein